jgi:transcriptional regulator with XRE-family HTH domain
MDRVLTTESLRAFVTSEMNKRGMSIRQFADFIGVSHPIISNIVNEGDSEITLKLLTSLAIATNTDVRVLVAMVVPNAVFRQDIDIIELAERIRRLPKEAQEIVRGFIKSDSFKGANQD